MFAPERIRIIKGILLNKKHINVTDLSNMLNVSEVTIRRDLEKLEGEKFLTRTHGGAIINDPAEDEEVLPVSDDPWFEERLEVGEVAAHMVLDGDVILLSSGSTNFCVARKILSKRNLTVLTNDLNIASELSTNPTIKVILPGGDLNPKGMTLSGKLTEENIRSFFVEKAFIEVEGASATRGYTVQSMEKASLIGEMVRITKQCIIVCHHRAFDNIAFSQIGPLSMANKVVSTPKVPDAYKKFFFENNIQLFTSINAYEGGI
jgi:DeoR/GlpR family transcriptional regulator of sugar metabolism